jgi:exosome complex RNA-binding protein Rrp4
LCGRQKLKDGQVVSITPFKIDLIVLDDSEMIDQEIDGAFL